MISHILQTHPDPRKMHAKRRSFSGLFQAILVWILGALLLSLWDSPEHTYTYVNENKNRFLRCSVHPLTLNNQREQVDDKISSIFSEVNF